MKNMIFKTAIMAVFALALMTGNALADDLPYINGLLSLSGSADALLNVSDNPETFYGFEFRSLSMSSKEEELRALGLWNDDLIARSTIIPDGKTPAGDFRSILTDPSVAPYLLFLVDFPVSASFNFLDSDGNFLGNIDDSVDFLFGTLGDFEFHITSIDLGSDIEIDDVGPKLGALFGLRGYVLADGFEKTFAEYSFSADSVNNGGTWTWTMNIESFGTDYNCIDDECYCLDGDCVPDVPEPGTLVLLGTGLLGAAIAARRKMAKK